MTSSRPYLRKKAVLIMYKVFLQFPEALRPAFPRLKEKLEDADPGMWKFNSFYEEEKNYTFMIYSNFT